MQGKIVGPVKILIGNTTYEDNIYVAPIEDKMLLGLNFLRRVGSRASAHLASDILTIGNGQLKMKFGGTSDSVNRVSRVTVTEHATIPPRTVARIRCKLNTPCQNT